MDKYNHKKKYGQNFLKNKKILGDIIDCIQVLPDDLIIEIGPGQGDLTRFLKLYDAKVLCYEIDKDLKKYLDKYEDIKTEVIYEDFLKADVKQKIRQIKYNNLYIIANIPYYITTPIIKKIINLELDVKKIVFLVQNELADRWSAQPSSKNYGAITVYLNYYFKINKLFFVGRNEFDPIPNVDSAVISLEKREKRYNVVDENLFFNLVNDAFRMKRKNLKNNLENYDLEKVDKILKNYGLSLQNRAENLSIDCFVDIVNELSK